MAGLQSTYGNDKSETTRANEMLETGQVPMDINAMPGLVKDKSGAENLDAEDKINALQGGEVCYFCKKPGHQKRDCRKFNEWKKKNPSRKYGSTTPNANSQPPISCYNCGKEGHISREYRGERKNQERRGNGRAGGRQLTEVVKSLTAMQEVLKKLAPDVVFPYGVVNSNNGRK